jgi:hypothetical protein
LSVSAAGSIVSAVDNFNGDGTPRGKATVTTSADGLSKVTSADLTGDGVTDRTTSEITTVINGVRTETVEQRSGSGALLAKTVTTISADGKGLRVQEDSDGDGVFERDLVTAVDAAGASRTTDLTLNADGTRKAYALTTVSADGLTETTELDVTGDGIIDEPSTDQTIVNADGSRTRTLSKRNSDGQLIAQQVTQTSADGLTVTGKIDLNGNGSFERSTTEVTARDASGSRTKTVTTRSANGTLLATTVTTLSADRSTTNTTVDGNADGKTDLTEVSVVNSDGSAVETTTAFNVNSTIRSKTVKTTSADGLTATVETDVDGNGLIDVKRTNATVLNANGSRTVTVSERAANNALLSSSGTTTSGNGLAIDGWSDVNGDGVVESRASDVTVLNQNGSTTKTVSARTGAGQLIDQTITTVSANGLSTVVQADLDGNGSIDRATTTLKELKADGSTVDSVSVKNGNNQVISDTATTTSANRQTVTTTTDLDGNQLNDIARTTVINRNGSVTDTVSTYAVQAGVNKLASRATTTVSADGLTERTESDLDGNGSIDQIDEAVTLLNSNGSRTETTKRLTGSGAIKEQTTVDVLVGGMTRITKWAATGDVVTRSLTEVTNFSPDGSTVETVTYTKAGGALESKTTKTVTADKLTETVTRDIDGDGIIDQKSVAVTDASGARITTLTELGTNGVTVIAGKTITEAANGLTTTIDYDTDGNGVLNSRTTEATVLNTNGSKATTVTRANGNLQTVDRSVIDRSADGLTVTEKWDLNADGVFDQSRSDVTAINADGSKTRTVSNFTGSTLTSRTETTTSANGLVATTRWDLDGSGSYEQVLTDQSVLNGDGSVTRTIASTKNGTLIARSATTISADGRGTSTSEERPGLGLGSCTSLTTRANLADDSSVETLKVSDASGKLIETQTATTSGDGREVKIVGDRDGNGTTDQIEEQFRLIDGLHRTVTTGYGAGNVKSDQTTTITAADGLTATTEWDQDGNGSIDRRRQTAKAFNIDGSQSSVVTDTSATGALLSRTTSTVTADGLTRVVMRDLNGDGVTDSTETTVEAMTGATATTVVNTVEARNGKYLLPGEVYWEKAIAARIETTVSTDGLTRTVRSDSDGNGSFEQTMVSTAQIDGSIQATITETNADGTIKAKGSLSESADGRVTILHKDIGNDGTIELSQTAVTALDGSVQRASVERQANGSLIKTVTESFNAPGTLTLRLITDAAGRKTEEGLFKADGSGTITQYDPANAQAWSSLVQSMNAAGQLTSQSMKNDNGTRQSTSFDPTNSQSWSQASYYYNAADQLTQGSVQYDNGTWSHTFYDPTNIQAWSSVVQSIDAAGKMKQQVKKNDDGSTETWQWDVDYVIDWSGGVDSLSIPLIYEVRSAAGQLIRQWMQWDDGSWSYPIPPVLLDLNGDDHIDLRPFDPVTLAGPRFDWDSDGVRDATAWVGPEDGFLAIDLGANGEAGGDAVIDQARELAFSLWADGAEGAVSDLEGLRLAFDSTGDNVLDPPAYPTKVQHGWPAVSHGRRWSDSIAPAACRRRTSHAVPN